LTAALPARAQSPSSPWTFSVSAGAFAVGTGRALSRWLDRNAYGNSHARCGFNIQLAKVCEPTDVYPQSEASRLAATASVRRTLRGRVGVQAFVSNEQSGTVTGRCDVDAATRDDRCTDPFLVVDFGGASVASLLDASVGKLRVGAGPAILFANWNLKPAHLAGAWIDATYGVRSSPFALRAQYRVYRSTTRSPSRGFDRVRPSTLFLGVAYAAGLEP
jgi:hypothetical protein